MTGDVQITTGADPVADDITVEGDVIAPGRPCRRSCSRPGTMDPSRFSDSQKSSPQVGVVVVLDLPGLEQRPGRPFEPGRPSQIAEMIGHSVRCTEVHDHPVVPPTWVSRRRRGTRERGDHRREPTIRAAVLLFMLFSSSWSCSMGISGSRWCRAGG